MNWNPNLHSFIFGILIGSLLLSTANLRAIDIGYDAAGRVVSSIQPGGQTTAFDYDSAGNIESIVSITPAEDSDADGLPDYFEIRFTGTTTALAPTDDTDQDGMNHLFEFAFARDPFISDAQEITPISLKVPDPQTDDQFFTLKYLRPQSGTQHLNYVTEISFDLKQPWLSNPPEVLETVVIQQDGGMEEVTVRFLPAVSTTDTLFMRISVQKL